MRAYDTYTIEETNENTARMGPTESTVSRAPPESTPSRKLREIYDLNPDQKSSNAGNSSQNSPEKEDEYGLQSIISTMKGNRKGETYENNDG